MATMPPIIPVHAFMDWFVAIVVGFQTPFLAAIVLASVY